MTHEDLLDIHALQNLKFRYIRAVDTHDWDLMNTLFADDASVWFANGAYSFTGRNRIMEFYRTLVGPSFISNHVAVHPEIELKGNGTATGVWRLVDTVHFLEDTPAVTHLAIKAGDQVNGAGYYYDEYVKTSGDWKIKSTGYVRIFEQHEPAAGRNAHLRAEPSMGRRL